ncbi:MAG: GDSL-type esterase/lipase family protein [Eubacteriales bacterium]|nr:GDSL-type esterase/lipase family protein [Eubacteriales bacterium]
MTHLLCLGDSITDCGRILGHPPLGNGYVYKLRKKLNTLNNDWNITNCGVDGFTVSRLLTGLRQGTIPYNADIISILIGINDIGLMMNTGRNAEQQHMMHKKFLSDYESLLITLNTDFHGGSSVNAGDVCCHSPLPPACIRKKPRIILLEPFIFTRPAGYINWLPHIQTMSQGISCLAEKYQCTYIRLQEDLNKAALEYGTDSVSEDGIHLTSCGHEILAEKLAGILSL